jgi:probable rRNA maturation factor
MIHIQINEKMEAAAAMLTALDQTVIERAAQQVLEHTGTDTTAEATIVLSDDNQLQALNRQFLGVDEPTDVLSFPGGETDPDSDALYLGDVILSLPRAQAQADAGGYTLLDEVQLLVVHGMLHLLGHNHAEEEDKARMWAAQAEILARLGCAARP